MFYAGLKFSQQFPKKYPSLFCSKQSAILRGNGENLRLDCCLRKEQKIMKFEQFSNWESFCSRRKKAKQYFTVLEYISVCPQDISYLYKQMVKGNGLEKKCKFILSSMFNPEHIF